MQITMDDEYKLVQVWLTNSEKDDPQIGQNLKPIYNKYKDSEYQVVVYKSGHQDLYENTLALLKSNMNRSAREEVQKARRSRDRER